MQNNRISALRHEYGLNQRELGEKLGVGQTTVSAWEKGRNEPDHETLHKMAQLFHCSIGYLTGYENDEQTRGLTQDELAKLQHERELEKALSRHEWEEEYQKTGLTPEEIEEYAEQEERIAFEAWLKSHPDCYYEAYRVNLMCDRLNAAQRSCLLEIALQFEKGINSSRK